MESIVKPAGQTTDSTLSKVLGSSAKPTSPGYHQHCPFRRLRKLIAGCSSGPAAVHLIADAASLRLGRGLVGFSSQRLKDIWCERVPSCSRIELLRLRRDAFSSTCSPVLHFSDGREGGTDGTPSPEKSRRKPSYARQMTDVFLTINILVYSGQVATWGKLLAWGAKVNHLIDKGQWWRLATSNFLTRERHAPPGSAMSYRFNKASSVGASGAFSGLVGYLAVHFLRHRGLTGDADKGLNYMGEILLFNMILGLTIKRIDNWGHVGGFLGGAAALWLLGPTGKLEYRSSDGRKAIDDIKGPEDPGAAVS